MSQETETETEDGPGLALDREQYVPDWIVEEAVGLALQTQLREPILAAVSAANVDETRTDGESIDVEAVTEEETDDADGGGGRLRSVAGLVAVAVGLFVAYRVLSKKRD